MSTTNPEVRDTEWDALQRKFGNLPPLPSRMTEEELSRRAVNTAEAIDSLAHRSLRELAALEDDVDENVLEQYRRRRIAEIRRRKQLDRFGELYHVGKNDFVQQVTRASAIDPMHHRSRDGIGENRKEEEEGEREEEPVRTTLSAPWGAASPFGVASASANTEIGTLRRSNGGTWIVVHLYRDSVPASEALNNVLPEVAKRHRDVKFVKAKAEDVIPHYPDSKIPTVLLYHGGFCQTQLIGRQRDWGAERATIAKFEKVLAQYGVLDSAGSGGEEGDGYISDDEEEKEETSRGRRHVRISYGGVGEGDRRRRTRRDESDEDMERARTRGYSSMTLDEKVQRGF